VKKQNPEGRIQNREGRTFPSFYPIIDIAICQGRGMDPVAVAEAALRGGARLFQLRHKFESALVGQQSGGSADFLELADRFSALAREHGASLIVNDRADIAQLAGAAGVHVGQDDMPLADVRRILGPAAIVGISTHDASQVDEAVAGGASYLAVGPIFHTDTKQTGYTPRGVDLVRYAAGRGLPVVAIGGITLARVPQVIGAGASAVAVITDLLAGDDPESRAREFVAAIAAANGHSGC
jgi:thiamine-phosphate pyrophosphorylase